MSQLCKLRKRKRKEEDISLQRYLAERLSEVTEDNIKCTKVSVRSKLNTIL